jgi:hypothetical protein
MARILPSTAAVRNSHSIGPYSHPNALRKLDRRTAMGRHIRDFEAGLVEHVGGAPSLPMRALIDQAVSLELQLALLERKGIETDHDRRCFAAWLNAKRLTLRAIGFEPAKAKQPTLAEHLATLAARHGKAA